VPASLNRVALESDPAARNPRRTGARPDRHRTGAAEPVV